MDMTVSPGAQAVMKRLSACGYEAWAVGGCVRDSLMGSVPQDFDLTTTALPEQVTACFAPESVIPTGLRHGTVTVLAGGEAVEVTTLRSDGSYADGRHPQGVTFVRELEADLARRDFTINAMAWNPTQGLVDPFGGQRDLANRWLRCVGDPATRLAEDSLRIMRGLRFAACLGFTIEEQTAAALHRQRAGLGRVSAERITAELLRLLCGDFAGAVLVEYQDILSVVFNNMILNVDKNIYLQVPKEAALRLALLMEGDTAQAEAALSFLRLDRDTERRTRLFVELLGENLPSCRSAAVPLVRKAGESVAEQLSILWQARAARCFGMERDELAGAAAAIQAILQDGCCKVDQLAIGGGELLARGIPAGREVGRLLNHLLEQVMAGQCPNTKKALIAAVLPLYPTIDP